MSKQGERKKREFREAKATAKLLKSQKNAQNQQAKAKTDGYGGQDNADYVIANHHLFETPWLLLALGTVIALLCAIIQPYSHSISIWIGFIALGIYAQALYFGILNDKKPAYQAKLVCLVVWILALICCGGLQIIELKSNPSPVGAQPLSQATKIQEPSPNPKSPEAPTTPPPQITNVAEPDYVEGTRFTHAELKDIFPFGYTIFYSDGNERFRYEVVTNGLLDWSIDLDNVKFEPDFSRGIVSLHIPPLSAKGKNGATMDDVEMGDGSMPFKTGAIFKFPFVFANLPAVWVAVLSDNQRMPVFALGFRIPTPFDNPTPPKP